MAASTPVPLTAKSKEAFIAYYKQVQNLSSENREDMRLRFTKIDKSYQREEDLTTEHTRAKQANNQGDTNRFQNITVPVVAPQVESAVTYQTSVFLTGSPLFGAVADPTFIDEALQLESVIDEQATRGGWTRELMMFFRHGYKYNFAPLEISWEQEVTQTIQTDLTVSAKEGIPKELLWSGNKVRSLDPYNTFVDPRVPPTEVYKEGEFAGWTEPMTRIKLKAFVEALPDKILSSITPAFESSSPATPTTTDSSADSVFTPEINPDVNPESAIGKTFSWDSWAGIAALKRTIEYKDAYEVTTLYCKVLPVEFGLKVPNRSIPQVYKLVIVNHEHVIYCERQTNAHNWLPILIGQPLEDGLGYQTKSLATNAVPFQHVASAYMNSIMHSRRRAISDRTLYDPSRITSAHINSDNPSAKIPVRPAAYGKNISESVYAFPYREDQAGNSMQQIQTLLGLANNLSGQNQASQGQFVKGNKTLHEFESVMQNANGRDQMASILFEAQVFMPMKHILKLNILQYQGGTTVYNRDKQRAVEIDPIKLRKAVLEFKISDGLVPSSKILNMETLSTALQVIGSSPQISGGYNVTQLFSYLMKGQGANLTEFEKSPEQMAYEQAAAQYSQMVNTAIENGIDPEKLPPQPNPADFGYDPAGNKPSPANPEAAEMGTASTPGAQ